MRLSRLSHFPLQKALHAFTHARMHEYAAMLSFFAVLGLPALFSLLFAVLRIILPQQDLIFLLSAFLPHALLQETLLPFLAQSYSQTLALPLVLSLSITLFALRNFFVYLAHALRVLWKQKTPHPPAHASSFFARAFFFLHVHALPFAPLALLGLSLLLLVFGNTLLHTIIPLPFAAHFLSSLFFLTLASTVCALFFLLSSVHVFSFRSAMQGGFFTALCLLFGQFVLSFYFRFADIEQSFGVLGSAAMLLLWIFYSLNIFLFGATVAGIDLQQKKLIQKRLS